MGPSTLKDRIAELTTRTPAPDSQYYALTILGNPSGDLEWHCYSHWVRFADKEERVELRAASIVRAELVCNGWREIEQSCAVVDNLDDMEIFFLIGGNALVEKSLGESAIKDWLDPQPVVQSGVRGFVHVEDLSKGAFNRAPTPKQRMQVIKRDDHKCRVCGRRATDYVDVELHVHHIRPWAQGGLTEDPNLITLCHTCHKGLAPHFDPALFGFIDPDRKDAMRKKRASNYWHGVYLYRERIVLRFSRGGKTHGESDT